MTVTQGFAKPPPWAESGNRFAVNPTGFYGCQPQGDIPISAKIRIAPFSVAVRRPFGPLPKKGGCIALMGNIPTRWIRQPPKLVRAHRTGLALWWTEWQPIDSKRFGDLAHSMVKKGH
jgi:hypothetical protein